ncbi:MAG: class I SAM-dependent methyltransferase [Nitrososphaeria archaeon]
MQKIEFDNLLRNYVDFRKVEESKGIDLEPFMMPLFSKNFAKKFVVIKKYRYISDFLQKHCTGGKALDFGTGFGAFLPILSKTHDEVVAVDAFLDQIIVAKDLVDYMRLNNVKVMQVPKENGLEIFPASEFNTILAADVLEHNLNYKQIVDEMVRILKPNGIVVVSLPTEHPIYRLFARKEVEKDEMRGHVYHSYKGFLEVKKYIDNKFKLLEEKDILTFIHIEILTNR